MSDPDKTQIRSSLGRIEGVKEQTARAAAFLQEARESQDALFRFRHVLAAVYAGRAAADIALTMTEMGEAGGMTREALKAKLVSLLPRYKLIEVIRLHDHHREGLRPLREGEFVMSGPVTLFANAKGSTALLKAGPLGMQPTTTEGAHVKMRRALQRQGGLVLDEDAGEWVPLEDAVIQYVAALPKVIELLEEIQKKAQ